MVALKKLDLASLSQDKCNALIKCVQDTMSAEEVDALVPEGGEFKKIADAIMAWWVLLYASGIIRKFGDAQKVVAGAMLMLGVLVKYTYALGIRRGERNMQQKHKK